MKSFQSGLLFFLLVLSSGLAYSQPPEITFTVVSVSCNGNSDGELTASVDPAPPGFTWLWSNNATTGHITGLVAGTYTVEVLVNGVPQCSASVDVHEPDPLTVALLPSTYASGHNISCNGLLNGAIDAEVLGGTPPYTYSWSPISCTLSSLRDVQAGPYTVTVTDNNGCVADESITLTEPPLLEIASITPVFPPEFNGYNISCFKASDGSIDLTVSGGAGNNVYLWNNGSFDQDPTYLKAGSYEVEVTDKNGCTARSSPVTLSEPPQIVIELAPYVYPNLYNISCWSCFNGSITSSVSGGISPYSYLWLPFEQTAHDISSLGEGNYTLEITDDNGCVEKTLIKLKQPERDDWRVNGNTGIDGAVNYIGTADQADLVIKTNAGERMRVTMDGKIGIGTASPSALLSVGSSSAFQVGSSGAIDAATGITSSGNITFSSLGAGLVKSTSGTLSIGIAGTDYQTPLVAGTDYQTPLVAGTDYQTPLVAGADYQTPLTGGTGISISSGGINTVWTLSSSNISSNNSGNVGIGITNPIGKFEVKDNSGKNSLEILSNDATPYRRGISLGLDANGNAVGSFNFWIHEWQNVDGSCAFNFKESNTGKTLMTIRQDQQALLDIGNFNTVHGTNRLTIGSSEGSALAYGTSYIGFNAVRSSNTWTSKSDGGHNGGAVIYGDINGNLRFINIDNSGSPTSDQTNSDGTVKGKTKMIIKPNGQVGIGTENIGSSSTLLAVDGRIVGRELKLTVNNFPDYVLVKGYRVPTISEIKDFIKINGHLDDIPSAKEVAANGGIEVGDFQIRLLKKLEELTLIIIKQDDQIQELKSEVQKLKK